MTDGSDAPGAATYRVHLCLGPNCSVRGSRALLPRLQATVARAGLADRVEVLATTCRDRCDYGPSMNVYPGPVFYNLLDEGAIEEIVARHLAGGEVAEGWLFQPKPARAKPGNRSWN
jgi:NADH-quinone oxidoreductase subunit F